METLISELGIDWRSLVSQAVNFLILLVALRFFVWQPLTRLLKERQRKIQESLIKAEEADRRLKEIDRIRKDKIKEAEKEVLKIFRAAEEKAKELEARFQAEAKRKENEELERLATLLRAKEEEGRLAIKKEAVELIKKAIIKTVEISPEQIDAALIKKAVEEIQ